MRSKREIIARIRTHKVWVKTKAENRNRVMTKVTWVVKRRKIAKIGKWEQTFEKD